MQLSNRIINVMHNMYVHKVPFLPKLLKVLIRVVFSCEIEPSCNIAKSAVLVHNGLGCVIHANAEIQEDVKIYQNVTLGGNGKNVGPKGSNHPIIRGGGNDILWSVCIRSCDGRQKCRGWCKRGGTL